MKLEKNRILMFRKDGGDWRSLWDFVFGRDRRTQSGASVRGAIVGLRTSGHEIGVAKRADVELGVGGWVQLKAGKRTHTLPKFS